MFQYRLYFFIIFHFQFERMSIKTFSKYQLQTLLESSEQEIFTFLLNPSGNSLKVFYQNFATISLKVMKYVNHYLNLLNSDQIIGRLIDTLHKKLSDSFRQYRIKNFGTNSNESQTFDHPIEDDQIYHFINTRNTLMPLDCLYSYENDKQRKELQQFVEQMSKHSKYNHKQPKRSLILPKENNFKLKFGRKATFDPELRFRQEQPIVESKTAVKFETTSSEKNWEHVYIQTDFAIKDEEIQKKKKTNEVETESQCDSVPFLEQISQVSPEIIQQTVNKTVNSKKKPSGNKEAKNKKKHHGVKNSNISFKQTMQVLNEHEEQHIQQPNEKKNEQCSLKTLNSTLKLNSKQLNLIVFESIIIDQSILDQIQIKNIQKQQQEIAIQQNQQDTHPQTKINDLSQVHNAVIISNENTQRNTQKQASILQDQDPEEGKIQPEKPQKSQKRVLKQPLDKLQDAIQQEQSFDGSLSLNMNKKSSNVSSQYKKVSVLNIRILQEDELEKQNINNHHKSRRQSQQILRKSLLGRHKTNIQISPDSKGHKQSNFKDIQLQNHIRSSALNLSGMQKMDIFSKQSQKYENKYVLQVGQKQRISQTTNQDYLVSRQKAKQVQASNRLNNKSPIKSRYDGISDFIRQKYTKRDQKEHSNNIKEGKTSYLSPSKHNRLSKKKLPKQSIMISISSSLKSSQNSNQKIVSQSSKHFDRKFICRTKKQIPSIISHFEQNNTVKSEQNSFSEIKSPQITIHPTPKMSLIYKQRNHECKTVDSTSISPKRSIFYNKSSDITPVKTSLSKIKTQLQQLQSQQIHQHLKKSSSEDQGLERMEFNDFKRKLNNKANADKLSQYLELIQTAHKRFCGNECRHIDELFKGKQGSVAEQIVRLFKRIKF